MGLGHIILIVGLLFLLADYITWWLLTCICKKAGKIISVKYDILPNNRKQFHCKKCNREISTEEIAKLIKL